MNGCNLYYKGSGRSTGERESALIVNQHTEAIYTYPEGYVTFLLNTALSKKSIVVTGFCVIIEFVVKHSYAVLYIESRTCITGD